MCSCMRIYSCKLTVGMHMRISVYVCVHIGAEEYLRGNYVFNFIRIKHRV